jgi:succinate dehydrogenase/fumarate reductase flavoprotein subunit
MSETNTQDWDHTVDLLVVGSGAGAMTAGIRAHDLGSNVLLIEKSDRYGGSSAMSGGGLWVPDNHLMPGVGIEDSREDALEYLREITAGSSTEERLEAYVDRSPELVKYLEETVAKMNEYAKTGKDPEFGRGDTAFDTYYGDETVEPNPNLAPIVKAPFYAMECYPGELGTKGGIRVDGRSRALSEAGEVIPGLYAIGNCSAAAMGRTYPGAGATLGPATTFGFIAAEDAVGH